MGLCYNNVGNIIVGSISLKFFRYGQVTKPVNMDTIQEIKLAIRKLPLGDLTRLREWFDELEAQLWDEQLKADIQAGKLDSLAVQALSDLKAGRCQEL